MRHGKAVEIPVSGGGVYAAPTPNVRTKSWSINITSPPARSFSYDTNGNTLSDGLRTYQWDAEDRLVKITQGANVYEFVYDGLSRRVVEKANGINTRRLLWDGTQIADQRDAAGTSIQRRYYSEGEQRIGGTDAGNYFYTRDHLGSIREITDSTAAIRARYDYDPYGKRTNLSGDLDCDFGFTGHYYHTGSNLHLALFRAYDQDLGRWLSADPIGEMGGLNLYGYVGGNPINFWDILGLTGYPSTFVGPLRGDDYYIPDGPPGADVKANCDKAKKIINPFTFKSMVKNKGPWDYKQHGRQYEDFGNYNYGATGHAFGFSLNTLYNEAGRAQVTAKTSNPAFGKPAPRLKMLFGCDGTGSRGDDPNDQLWIKRGYEAWRPYYRGSK